MNNAYEDIIEAVGGRDPDWYDENGTPRFGPHHPKHCPDIYAVEIALLEIACQACDRRFNVQMSAGAYSECKSLQPLIENGSIHYGDPPNVGCCAAGPTMNCVDLRVIEFWAHTRPHVVRGWERITRLEVDLPKDAEVEP